MDVNVRLLDARVLSILCSSAILSHFSFSFVIIMVYFYLKVMVVGYIGKVYIVLVCTVVCKYKVVGD